MVPAAKKSQPVRYKLFGCCTIMGCRLRGGIIHTLDVLHPDRYPASSLSSSSGVYYSSSLSTSDSPRASSNPATSTSTPTSREGWVRMMWWWMCLLRMCLGLVEIRRGMRRGGRICCFIGGFRVSMAVGGGWNLILFSIFSD